MLAEKPLKSGQVIDYEGDSYKAIRVYSHHVLHQNIETRIMRDVTNADLMVAGIVHQKGVQFEINKKIKNMVNPDSSYGRGMAKRWTR